MAKKLSADLTATLKKLGIKAKTEEEAHDKLIAILEKNGIEGMEDESLTALIDMADAFLNDPDNSEDEVEDEVEETEDDEVDDTEEEKDDETDSEEVEADDDEEMDELANEVEADDAEAEEAKKEEKKAKKAEKPEKKSEKKTAEKKQRKSGKNGVKLNPKVNVEDREALATLREIFPEKDYEFNWIVGGVTIKYIGKNSKRAVLSVYDLARKDDGTINFTLLFNTMTKETEKLDELGLEYAVSNWTKQPFIKNVTPEYAKEVIGMLLEIILGFIGKVDKRLGENRKKMEENLKKTEKKATKKAEQSQDAEDEVEDEVDEEPKKATKKVSKKSKK